MLTNWIKIFREKQLEFWVKWTASPLALVHVYVTAHDVYPWYKFTGITTALLWLWLGYLWRQPSLMGLNTIMSLIYLKGILGL
jgi:hypothetical protein